MPPILFGVQSYQHKSLPVSGQRLVNMYMEKQPTQEAKGPITLLLVPGSELFTTAGDGPVRGFRVMRGILYTVSGEKLYEVASDGTVTELGDGITGTRPVSMSDNGTQIAIANGVDFFIYDIDTGFSASSTAVDTVDFFDTYFVINVPGTNQYRLSAQLDGLSFPALSFASAEASSAPLIGLAQNMQLLFLFSSDHIEIWYNAGTPDFPFQRYAGGVIWRGCRAAKSIIRQDTALFFLGDDLVFYRLQGNVPIRMSTHAIESIIANDPTPELAHCFNHNIEGHKFIYLTLPGSNRTLGFDALTQTWHERESRDDENNDLVRWRGNTSIEAYGNTYVGDYFSGAIYRMADDIYAEDGNTIRALAHSAPVHFDRKRIFMDRLEVHVETGVGLTSGQGSNPRVGLRYSKDGARTWSDLQPYRSMGLIGEYTKRLRWDRLGAGYDWTFELEMSDPTKRVVIGAHANLTIGM